MNDLNIDPNDPTLGEAFAQIDRELGADASGIAPADTAKPDSTPDAPPVPTPDTTEGQPPEPSKEGALATAPDSKPTESKAEPTKYEKAAGRQAEAWKQINTEKEEVRTLRKQIEAEREAIKAERAAVETEKTKAAQPKYTPEQYETAADKWEAEGKLDLAEAARKQAKELRDNPPKPPVTPVEQQEQFKAQQKEWWGKAAIDFPDVAKKDSPEAQALAALVKAEPAIYNDPKGMYYAARLVCAEVAAARAPSLDKELGIANAKIKDLEKKLAIPGDGAVSGAPHGEVPFEQKSEAEQEAQMFREARAMDSSGRW
jgi:hypothetical protein